MENKEINSIDKWGFVGEGIETIHASRRSEIRFTSRSQLIEFRDAINRQLASRPDAQEFTLVFVYND